VTGLSQGTVQLPFTLFYFVFPATLIFANRLLSKLGPRRCSTLGGIFFGGGWILAGFGQKSFIFTSSGIGILAGFGAGLVYLVPITVCIRWFPKHKGLVTGIAVAGFGGGAALVTQIAGWLVHGQGLSVFSTMMACGCFFTITICIAGLVMKMPPAFDQKSVTAKTLQAVISKGPFRLLYGAMLIGLAAGFAINANLKELQPVPDLQIGILAVSLFAIANALGRIVWGAIFDRLNPALVIQLNLLAQAAVITVLVGVTQWSSAMLIFAFLSGFNFGGVLVIYAASVSQVWGEAHVGQIYGWLFSANILAALSPVLAGYNYDQTGNFYAVLLSLAAALILAALLVQRYKQQLQPVQS
jgi:OFA family oxalate/formate antiporter-like MFS transporter